MKRLWGLWGVGGVRMGRKYSEYVGNVRSELYIYRDG